MTGTDILDQGHALTIVVLAELPATVQRRGLEWQDKARCAETSPDAFFPGDGVSSRAAKQVCGECEVRPQCLDYALTQGIVHGVWGGLSEQERRDMRTATA